MTIPFGSKEHMDIIAKMHNSSLYSLWQDKKIKVKAKITVIFDAILEDGDTPESAAQFYKDWLIEASSEFADNFIVTGEPITCQPTE